MEIRSPVDCDSLRDLKVGDEVYVTGNILTARDLAHRRIIEYLEEGRELPFEIDRSIIYHCGPLIKDGKVLSAGPTTSSRMNNVMRKILRYVNCMVIVGKGGMDVDIRGKGVYLAYTGGCGAVATKYIRKVRGVHWLDLGVVEAVWILEVHRFPCIVAIDFEGRSVYEDVRRKVEDSYERMVCKDKGHDRDF